MAKANYEFSIYSYGLLFIWPVILLISIYEGFVTIFVAGSVVISGLSFFLAVFNIIPKRYKILYKKS